MQSRMLISVLIGASFWIADTFQCNAQEPHDNERGGLVKLTDSAPSVYSRSRITMREASTQFPLLRGMNAERFVEFTNRVDGTFVSFGRGAKFYDIVPEHIFIKLADGNLTVRMVPEAEFDPRAGQPLQGAPKRYGINRMVIESYFVHSEKRFPDQPSQWKQLPCDDTMPSTGMAK